MHLRSPRAAALALAAGAVLACVPPGREAPEVPDPDLRLLEPQVVEAMTNARADVLREPDSAEAWGALGAVYDAHLQPDLAESCYRQAHALAPGDFRWLYLLAIIREINGATADEVTSLFGRAVALRPGYAATHLRLGGALWQRGRPEDARRELERALELAPRMALAERYLGQVLLAQGDPAAARRHLERAIELEPRDLAAYTALAQACTRAGETALAEQTLERAAGLEPVNQVDDPVHAAEVVARTVGSEYLFRRAVALIEGEQYEAAIAALETVVAAIPGNPSAWYWRGVARSRAGRLPEAIDDLVRAIELEPRLNAARLELVKALTAAGRDAEAAEHSRQAQRYQSPSAQEAGPTRSIRQ